MPGSSEITVANLLRLALPVGTAIIAGHQNTQRPVTWVSVLNTRPPAFPDLRGGEIALLSLDAMRLLSDKLTLGGLVRDLAEMEVSAIGVLGEIGQPAAAAADGAGIVLLHLPDVSRAAGTDSRRVPSSCRS